MLSFCGLQARKVANLPLPTHRAGCRSSIAPAGRDATTTDDSEVTSPPPSRAIDTKPPGCGGANGYFEYPQTVQPKGLHGDALYHRTISTDAPGRVVSRVGGKEVTELLSDKIGRRIVAEQGA